MSPGEKAERAYLEARYNVTDEQLVARINAAPDMGGSLLVELSEFMEKKMTAEKIEAWRRMGHVYLEDARQEVLSMPSRADAAFDACYMYARCVVGKQSEQYEHPDPAVLNLAAAKLGWTHCVLRPVRQYLYKRDDSLRDGIQFDVLMELTLRLKDAAGAPPKTPISK